MILLPELDPASSSCQRWRNGRHSWRRTSEGGFDPNRYGVKEMQGRRRGQTGPSDYETGKAFVLTHHYAGTWPSPKRVYGLFDLAQEDLVGVAVTSVPGGQKSVLTGPFPTLEAYYESVELGRFVLLDQVPANAETWFLARVLQAEAATHGVRGVVSMADPVRRTAADGTTVFLGHRGAIYQAANAVYYGRCRPDAVDLLPDGTVLTNRAKAKVRNVEMGHEGVERRLMAWGAPAPRAGELPAAWLDRAMAAIGVRRVRHGGNHRYAFPIGPRRRRPVVQKPTSPYPKDEAA